MKSAHELKMKSLDDLVPYSQNARTHTPEQIDQVAASIKEFGFNNPILLDSENGIIAGHCRSLAARKLGMEKVPTITLDHLNDVERRAYILADNRLALDAGWDDALLASELQRLNGEIDLSLLGFGADELSALLDSLDQTEGLTHEDEVPEPPETPVTAFGDVWLLGKHRLMCGDSTSIDDVKKLMNGQKADLVFTDPPYNVSFNGRSGNHEVIKNDNLTPTEFEQFIKGFCSVLTTINPTVYYIWCNWSFYGLLQEQLNFKSCIVWAKNVFGMGVGYRHQHEFCLFNGKIDASIKNESDLWSVAKDHNYMHPTQKPVALSVRAFGNHIRLINVLDFFGGSGSTLIGAEQTGRKCFVLELDPKYCDVIIKRWQDFTGREATHEGSGKTYNALAS